MRLDRARGHRHTRKGRHLLPSLLGVLLLAAAPLPVGAAPAPPASGGAARLTSDQAADSLFAALQRRDYGAAFALFDDKMKAAVPEEKLRALWEEQIARLGPFQSWQRQAGEPAQGYEVQLASLKFDRGELKAMVAVQPATGRVGGFFVRPGTQPALGHPAYADTTRFRALDVSVISDKPPLGATLTMPAGAGPFPAAVLVHGSGPQDRDETVGANKVFRDIAEGLASRGIAVLRYDKRSLRYPDALKKNPTIDDEVVLDAIQAVELLRSRPDVDPKRIFVIGHSLGALLAPEIGVRSGSVAGVALLAPPGRRPWEILAAQMRYLGAPAAEVERIAALDRAASSGSLAGDSVVAGAPVSYWMDWGRRDGPAQAKKLGRPVLVLHGERDYQVGDEDIAIWKKRLSGDAGVRFVSYPGLNHLFVEGTGKPGPAEYETPGHVDGRVIEALAGFIAAGEAAAPRKN